MAPPLGASERKEFNTEGTESAEITEKCGARVC